MPDTENTPQDDSFSQLLGWPPPGLGRVQGDLWLVVRKMALTGIVLVVPILFVLTMEQSTSGLGPLGDGWWVLLVTTVLGLIFLADASVALVRMLARIRRAMGQGYSGHVVGLVISDRDRDNGFVLQGAQVYSSMQDGERGALARLRLGAPVLYLLATTWFVLGFGVLVLLAARGVLSPGGLAMGTVLPAAVFVGLGMVCRATEGTLSGRARQAWFRQSWAEELARQDVEEWRAAGVERGVIEDDVRGIPMWLRPAVIGVVAVSLLSVVAPATLVPASSIGAVLASMTGFRYSRTQEKIAAAEAYRSLRLEPDPTVTPMEAGEILHVLSFVGQTGAVPDGFKDPVRVYEEGWLPSEAPEGWRAELPMSWTDSIWLELDVGVAAERLAYLRMVAAHPAHAEFSRLARAAALDAMGPRVTLPLPEGATFFEVPIPRFSSLRSAAYAHLAIAALESQAGRHAAAEQAVREVVSVGFLLMEEAPTLIGNLIGSVLVGTGADAMRQVLRRSGDVNRLALLDATALASQAAVQRMSVSLSRSTDTGSFLTDVKAVAQDEGAIRGLRWEFVHLAAVVTPCLNMRTIVFGPGQDYVDWLAGVRRSLVRFDSDVVLFDLASEGLAPQGREGSFLAPLFTVAMGGGGATCARVIEALPGIM